MNAKINISIERKLAVCNKLINEKLNWYTPKDFIRVLKLSDKNIEGGKGINIDKYEAKNQFCEIFYLHSNGKATKATLADCISSYNILKNIPVDDELKFIFYKHVYLSGPSLFVEVKLAKLLEEKFPEYKKCSRYMIYKYVFNEYCKYKPSNVSYNQNYRFTEKERIQYLEYAINEVEKRLCNTI